MKINSSSIKSSKIYRTAITWANKSFVAKTIGLIIIWLVVSIPFDLYLLLRWFVDPVGFWQELALCIVVVVVLGWLQGLLLFFGIVLSISLILEEF